MSAWLAREIDRLWLLGDRALAAQQQMRLRPPPGHPALAAIECTLAARRSDTADRTQKLAELEREVLALRARSSLGRLVTVLDLRPLEIEALVALVALELEPALGDLVAVLRGSASRAGIDLATVASLLELAPSHRVRLLDVVDAERPLRRWRLIDVAPADTAEANASLQRRTLRPHLDLLACVGGRAELPLDLARVTTITRAPANLDDLVLDDAMREAAQRACEAARGPGAPWLVLWGPAGVGKRTLAARIAAAGGRPLVTLDLADVPPSELAEVSARVMRETMLRGAALHFARVPAALISSTALTAQLPGFRGPISLGVDDTEPPRLVTSHPVRELAVRLPSPRARVALWSRALPADRRGADLRIDEVAGAFHLAPGEIAASAHEALLEAGAAPVGHRGVREAIARRLRTELGALARPIAVTAKWDDLVLSPEELSRVHEFIARKRHAGRVFEDWGYGERVSARGLVALFSGPPGTGKTMLAGIIARELDLELYQVDLAQVVSRWVGETEKQLGAVFERAERAHAVLLFDEADSLFAKRTDVEGSNDRYANLAVNYLLQRLEQYTGVAILTTNKDAALDEALQRRLALQLRIDIPEPDERIRLWRTFLPARAPVAGKLDFTTLANEFELSGGYIKNAAIRAAFLAAARDTPITMELLRLAAALELEDMGRVVWRRTA